MPWRRPRPVADDVATTTTGPDGRFRLTGIGRERIAELSISGPTIATTEVYAMNRDGPEIRASRTGDCGHGQDRSSIHARRFEYAVAPTKPVEGIVRDKDTGRPIAGLTLHAAVYRGRAPSARSRASRRRPTPRAAIASSACPRRPPINWPSSRLRGSLTPRRPSGCRPARPRSSPSRSTSRSSGAS